MAAPLLAALVCQRRDTVPKHFLRPPIVAQVVVDLPQRSVRQSLEGGIAKGHGEIEHTLARRQGPVIVAYEPEMIGDIAGDLGKLPVRPAGFRDAFGLAQDVEDPLLRLPCPESH